MHFLFWDLTNLCKLVQIITISREVFPDALSSPLRERMRTSHGQLCGVLGVPCTEAGRYVQAKYSIYATLCAHYPGTAWLDRISVRLKCNPWKELGVHAAKADS